jgi:hypothetical protein
LVAVIAVALLVGCGSVPRAAPKADAHIDAQVAGFRAVVDRDMEDINAPFDKSSRCHSRQVCTADLAETRAASEALLRDLAAVPAPVVFVRVDSEMKIAAGQFIDQLDLALAQLQQPSSEYLAASGIPRSYNLRLAAAAVDCWPGKPLPWDKTDNLGDNAGIPCA